MYTIDRSDVNGLTHNCGEASGEDQWFMQYGMYVASGQCVVWHYHKTRHGPPEIQEDRGVFELVPCVDLRSQGSGPSSIGAAAFHGPVRDGTGWVHRARHTPTGTQADSRPTLPTEACLLCFSSDLSAHPGCGGKPSTLHIRRLNMLPCVQLELRTPVISRESYLARPVRLFIFRCISHLDAFSGSCVRT